MLYGKDIARYLSIFHSLQCFKIACDDFYSLNCNFELRFLKWIFRFQNLQLLIRFCNVTSLNQQWSVSLMKFLIGNYLYFRIGFHFAGRNHSERCTDPPADGAEQDVTHGQGKTGGGNDCARRYSGGKPAFLITETFFCNSTSGSLNMKESFI